MPKRTKEQELDSGITEALGLDKPPAAPDYDRWEAMAEPVARTDRTPSKSKKTSQPSKAVQRPQASKKPRQYSVRSLRVVQLTLYVFSALAMVGGVIKIVDGVKDYSRAEAAEPNLSTVMVKMGAETSIEIGLGAIISAFLILLFVGCSEILVDIRERISE